MARRLSSLSTDTLARLDSLDRGFETIEHAVHEVEQAVELGLDDASLAAAKNRLAQLNGDLERFQFGKVDAVETTELTSGKAQAKQQRKRLNDEVEALRSRTAELHQRIVDLLQQRRVEVAQSNAKHGKEEGEEVPKPSANPSLGGQASSYLMPTEDPLDLPPEEQAVYVSHQQSWMPGEPVPAVQLRQDELTVVLLAIQRLSRDGTIDAARTAKLKDLLITGDPTFASTARHLGVKSVEFERMLIWG